MVKYAKKQPFLAFFSLLFIVFYTGCKKPVLSPETRILGKGGMGNSHTYPMNSKAAYLEALQHNLDGVEVDIQLTKDGQLIAFHSERLEEVTNMSGYVYDYTWQELQENCRYNDHRFKLYTLISLDEILEIFPAGAFLSLDVKLFIPNNEQASQYLSTYVQALKNVYNRKPDIVLESSFHYYAEILKTVHPQVPVFLVTNDVYQGMATAINLNLAGIVVPDTEANAAVMESARNKAIRIGIWQTAKNIHYSLDLKPDFFQTNNVSRFGK